MIEVVLNDRLGKKVRVKCNEDDTIGDLKRLVAAQTGTRAEKIRIQKWYTIYKDHITLADYESTTAWASSSTTTSSLVLLWQRSPRSGPIPWVRDQITGSSLFFSLEVYMYAYHVM
ncbi:unnamed protein product [Urochloa humidicola]